MTGGVEKGETPRTLDVWASLTNSGAGHSMPTGLPGIRNLFLRVEIGDASGVLKTQEFHYRQRLVDENGNDALPWEAFVLEEDTRLLPGETREEWVEWSLPEDLEGPLQVRAELRYEWMSESTRSRLELPARPPMIVASREIEVRLD